MASMCSSWDMLTHTSHNSLAPYLALVPRYCKTVSRYSTPQSLTAKTGYPSSGPKNLPESGDKLLYGPRLKLSEFSNQLSHIKLSAQELFHFYPLWLIIDIQHFRDTLSTLSRKKPQKDSTALPLNRSKIIEDAQRDVTTRDV